MAAPPFGDCEMISIAQKLVQPGKPFENVIYKYQKLAKDPRPEEIHTEWLFGDGKMFSSSGRGGLFAGHGLWPGIGTRYINYSRIELPKWKIYRTNISEKEEKQIRANCDRILGLRYDWLGIIGQPLSIQAWWMWYCSESINHTAALEKIAEPNNRIRPGQIIESFENQGIIAA